MITKSTYRARMASIQKASSKLGDALIEAGRGNEPAHVTLKGTDPLSLKFIALFERKNAIEDEAVAKWGTQWRFSI